MGDLMSILDSFFASFRKQQEAAPPPKPGPASDSEDEPPQQTILRTLVIVYDPIVDKSTGAKLSQYMHWNSVEELARGYMSDVLQASNGLVRHQITERIDVDEFPVKVDGYLYDMPAYLDVIRGIKQPYMPQMANYYEIVERFNLLQRVANDEIDEVWLFAFPHGGFYESIMAGPGAFWCNAPPLLNTDASLRRFVIMGFSYERGVGEMLEDLGHRAESIMQRTFEHLHGVDNLWERFTRYDKINPGNAALGNVHFAPNSDRDYDWNNPATVRSECDDWLYNFPHFQGVSRMVTASEWGNGDIRKHHVWWLSHLPKTAGRKNGIHNNWWQYIMNPNNVNL